MPVDPFTPVIFTAKSGALSVRLDREDGTSLHLHSIVDPEKEADYFSGLELWGDRIILAGCGLGYHIRKALSAIRNGSRVLLIEFYEELADRALESFPKEIRNNTVVVTAASKYPEEEIKTFMKSCNNLQIVKHPPSYKAHEEFYCRMLDAVIPSRGTHDAIMPSAKAPRRPNSVLLMQGDFFVEQELRRVAEQNGMKTSILFYKSENSIVGYESNLQKLIMKGGTDLIVSVNMLGFDGDGILGEYSYRMGIPVAVWFVDDPRPILLNR